MLCDSLHANFLNQSYLISSDPVAERLRSLDHFNAVSGVGSSPALATCETSQVLLAGVPGGFPVFAHLLIDPSQIILK